MANMKQSCMLLYHYMTAYLQMYVKTMIFIGLNHKKISICQYCFNLSWTHTAHDGLREAVCVTLFLCLHKNTGLKIQMNPSPVLYSCYYA